MKENEYDNKIFFEKYSKMERSVKGLQGAGEWHELKKMIPNLKDKNVLDLGCGFGWHCKYAEENGANKIVGIDISQNMLDKAKEINSASNIVYEKCTMEDYNYPANTFDVVISSLALHYIESFEEVCKKVHTTLREKGEFIFSVEHPIFTANGTERWNTNEEGKIENWPIDNYFEERKIVSNFLGEEVVKYHKTVTTFIMGLVHNGFSIQKVIEPKPSEEMLSTIPEMQDELRRPMMLLISAIKSK